MKPVALVAALLIALAAGHAPVAQADVVDDAKAALEAFQRQDFKAAIALLDKVLEDKGLSPQGRSGILVYRGGGKYSLGETDAAIADFNAAIAVDPQSVDAHTNLGLVYQEQGKYELAATHHRQALEIRKGQPPTPEAVAAHNNLAWLLATCPDSKVRNGKAAVELATNALTLLTTHWPKADKPIVANTYDTLAAAYAETSRFKDAIVAEEKGIAMLDAGAAEGGAFQQHLASYRAGKPWRLK